MARIYKFFCNLARDIKKESESETDSNYLL